MAKRLSAWGTDPERAKVVQQLAAQLDAQCAQLPAQDEARSACQTVFHPTGKPS